MQNEMLVCSQTIIWKLLVWNYQTISDEVVNVWTIRLTFRGKPNVIPRVKKKFECKYRYSTVSKI